MQKMTRAIIINLFLALPLLAQSYSDIVRITLDVDHTSVRSGEQIQLIAHIQIADGWHIYSSDLKGFGPVPTHFELDLPELVQASNPVDEPEPHRTWDEGFEMDVGWHSGTLIFSQTFQLADSLPLGQLMLPGKLVYMACTDSECLAPHQTDFHFALHVSEGPVRAEHEFVPEKASQAALSGIADTDIQAAIREGLFAFILLAIGMGFLALLTPCVFPMIPITVSFFLKQGESGGISPLRGAGLYALGIVVIYSLLGFILALTLGATGANRVAANPWINLILAALFIYFALSLLGMYEIQVPSRLRQFSLSQEGRGGMIGIFFMALTFTLTSFTCTVQFVGLLLVAASQGHYLWPAIGMVIYSATFAFPFFLLALFPQYIAQLPKSGSWLNSVKVVMGFLEFAAAFKFISNSDLVWGWQFFDHQVVLAAWTIILLLTGLYLLGKIRLPHDSPIDSISVPRLLLSSTFFILALLLGAGLVGVRIPGLVEAYLPPKIGEDSGVVLGSELATLQWVEDYDEALIQARRTGKNIFLDVTGYTCTNCRWMEANIFTKSQIASRFENFILLRIYTDAGENYREKQRWATARFGTAALPFYAIIAPSGRELKRFPGMTRDADEFATFLDAGLK